MKQLFTIFFLLIIFISKAQDSLIEKKCKAYLVNNYGDENVPDVYTLDNEYNKNGELKYYSCKTKKLKYVCNYKNDKPHGFCIKYNENGIISEEGIFENGEYNGEWISYNDDGKIKTKGNYIIVINSGEENAWIMTEHDDGYFYSYYENGQLQSKENYKDYKRNGKSEYYTEEGKLEKTETYKNGELVK